MRMPRHGSFAPWMAAGVWCSVAVLSWFGYHAVREWQASSALLEQRRTSDAADLLVTALSRDMRGVQDSVLRSSDWTDAMLDPPYDIGTVLASAFARYPYPESFFGWRGALTPSAVVFFHRTDRLPPWSAPSGESERFPIVVSQEPPTARAFAARLERDGARGAELSIFEMRLDGAPYQVVTRLIYDDPFHEHLRGGLGFTVNLAWVRRFYFPELTRQVSRIGTTTSGLALAVVDDAGQRVTAADTEHPSGRRSRRTFPLLFVNPLLVALNRPADLPARDWAVVVEGAAQAQTVRTLPFGDAARTLFIVALAGGVLAVGLAMTSQAARASARLAEMRSDFVATVTHELKTPLATIRAIGDSVASGRVTSPDTLRDYAQIVVQESRRLTRLVDNSLAYARVTDVTNVYHFEPLDVGTLLDETAHGFASQLSTHGFTIDAEVAADLPPVRGDRTAIGLLLDNLIDNAIRYSGESRWLGVRASQTGQCVRISIVDRGIGIPEDELQQVTRKFFRGRNAGSGGSGLGLAIVNRIALAHGGRLVLESAIAHGTTASVELPIADEEQREQHDAETNPRHRG